MAEEEQVLATLDERMTEMVALRVAFQARHMKPPEQWLTNCISVIGVWLLGAIKPEDKADLLVTLALAMWQAGYEAASKPDFMLPEGGQG